MIPTKGEPVDVAFRRFRSGQVVALFPANYADDPYHLWAYLSGKGFVKAPQNHFVAKTTRAREWQLLGLLEEIEREGYRVRVILRFYPARYLSVRKQRYLKDREA